MKDELARSMSGLRIKDEPPPYYIEYHVDETVTMRAAARLGAIEVHEPASRLRTLRRRGPRRRLPVRQLAVRDAGPRRLRAARRRQRGDDARRRLRRDPPAAVAGDRRGVQARAQHLRAQEGRVPESRQCRSPARLLARNAGDHDSSDAGSSCRSHRLGAAHSRLVGGPPIESPASILGGLGRRAVTAPTTSSTAKASRW